MEGKFDLLQALSQAQLSRNLHDYDVVVLDVNMPGMSGIELARLLRSSGAYTGSTIVISGRVSSDELRTLTAAGVTAVLSKPFELDEIQAAVTSCLRSAAAR